MFTKFTAQWTSAGCLMQHCANIIKNSLELWAYRQSSTDLETIPSLILAALAKVANGLGRQFGIEHGSPLDEWNCFESGKVAFWQGSCHVCGNYDLYDFGSVGQILVRTVTKKVLSAWLLLIGRLQGPQTAGQIQSLRPWPWLGWRMPLLECCKPSDAIDAMVEVRWYHFHIFSSAKSIQFLAC